MPILVTYHSPGPVRSGTARCGLVWSGAVNSQTPFRRHTRRQSLLFSLDSSRYSGCPIFRFLTVSVISVPRMEIKVKIALFFVPVPMRVSGRCHHRDVVNIDIYSKHSSASTRSNNCLFSWISGNYADWLRHSRLLTSSVNVHCWISCIWVIYKYKLP